VTPEFANFMDECQRRFSLSLSTARLPLPPATAIGTLQEAVDYSLASGGKRVRPMLAYAAAAAVAAPGDGAGVEQAALAVELIHTYSLIHDDLPAMDDDDLRRGRPSLHRAYDEATAILVGDGLQARAFELIADAPELAPGQKVHMVKVLAQAAGLAGMVGGQHVDIQATDSSMAVDALRAMHELKTGALIRAALALGAIAAAATPAQLAALDDYGAQIGLAFQVVDDILDVEGDAATLGKTSGKDTAANKPTYVKLLGLDGAKAEAQRLLQAALAALEGFGDAADHLRELARYIVARDR